MAGSLILLLDDIATVLDDVSVMTKVAVKQAGTPWHSGNKGGLKSVDEDAEVNNEEDSDDEDGPDKVCAP